jgi:hypothetical protein
MSKTLVTRHVQRVIDRAASERSVVRRHELRTRQLQRLLTIEREGSTRFFERIASRSERVERLPSLLHTPPGSERRRRPDLRPPRADGASHLAPVPAPAPRELVTRRLRIERGEQPATQTEAARADAARAPGGAPAPAVSGPPAVDVGRLADQVIDVIDRRIVAQRERLGRP